MQSIANDGQIDVAISNVNDRPDLYRLIGDPANHWITLTLVGTSSNRNAIGARVRCVTGSVQQWQEVRGGGSYMSQNDLRVNFGLAQARRVDRIDVRWPNGTGRELRESRRRQVSHLERGERACRDGPVEAVELLTPCSSVSPRRS